MRILLVDDQEDVLETLAVLLEDRGAQVVTSLGADGALEFVRTRPIDAMISDIAMPKTNGWDLLRRVRAEPLGRRLPAIAISALYAEPFIVRARVAGYAELVPKPVDIERLTALIVDLVERRGD